MKKNYESNFSYLIIGSGKVARQLSSYMAGRQWNFQQWSRSQNEIDELKYKVTSATHILILISDSSIESFYQFNVKPHIQNQLCIHMSGALEIPEMIGIHPLASITPTMLNSEQFEKIHFITTTDKPLCEILPGFKNQTHSIRPELKAKYHSICVMSGNFTVILWQKIFQEFDFLQIPKSAIEIYMTQIFENIKRTPYQALTGPLARKDDLTIRKNIASLENDPYQQIYSSFVKAIYPEFYQNKELK